MGHRKSFFLLTVYFEKEAHARWTAECKELGTATYADSLEQAKKEIEEAIELHLSTLEDVGERKNFFREHGIRVFHIPPKKIDVDVSTKRNIFISTEIRQLAYV